MGTSLELTAGSAGLEWAIYSFAPASAFAITAVELDLTQQSGDTWVGIANFDLLSWELMGPYVSTPIVLPLDQQLHASPAGKVHIAVLVYDSGQSRIDSVQLTVEGPVWEPVVVDSTPGSGIANALDVVAGHPAIAYANTHAALDVRFVRASDSTGASWEAPVIVDSSNYALDTDLEVVNGHPAITYAKGNSEFIYIRALDPEGSNWGAPVVVDTNVSRHSLKVVNGRPAIGYYEFAAGDLKYVRADDVNGAGWGTPQLLDGAASNVGENASMQLVDGFPALTYRDIDNKDLRFIRAQDSDGTAWGAPQVLDSAGDVGLQCSLAVVNESPGPALPAIVYRDDTNITLKFIRASDAGGNAWDPPQILNPSLFGGFFPVLDVMGGVPVVAYNASGLTFLEASDPLGLAWGTPQVADPVPESWALRLAEVDLQPAMSYYDFAGKDFSEGQLKYVRRN